MESREWTHPDVSLPQLLSLIRAFVDMLLLASGYQPTGSPALWRSQDAQRALGWASLLEQELCCLQTLGHKQSVLIKKLLEPCDGMSCSSKAFKFSHPNYHTIEAIQSQAADAVETFLDELAQQDNSLWWSLSPILVAATLRKESLLFRHYVAELCKHVKSGCDAELSRNGLNKGYAELSRHMEYGSNADLSRQMQEPGSSDDVLETGAYDAYDLVARSWCLDFVEQIDNSGEH